jgi:hypothetical protein
LRTALLDLTVQPHFLQQMPHTLYFHITLEPHHRHSGARTGRKINFLAEVPLTAAQKTAKSPNNEQSVYEEAERLAADLTSAAMTGQSHQPGEDEMRISCHAIPKMAEEMIERRPDAEKDGVRVWLLGANAE